MKISHVYWFSFYNHDDPSVRYRGKYALQFLKTEYGITYSISYPDYGYKSILQFIYTFFSALLFRKRNSIIVFQKVYTNGIYASALKVLLFFRPKNTLYDIDDAEHTSHPVNTLHYFMQRCSVISAGSKALVEYGQRFNKNVFLLTSPVIEHGIFKTEKENIFTVGWIGYYGAHRQSLTTLFFPALHAINFPLKLKLLGVANTTEHLEITNYFKENKNITIDAPIGLDWHNERFIYQHIATFDVGVSPLLNTEFNRAKSAFKLKQCLSCGVPVLASSVGENKAFLTDGVNGFFCDNPNAYYERLLHLHSIKKETYAWFMGHAKNTTVNFSMQTYCVSLLNYFGKQ